MRDIPDMFHGKRVLVVEDEYLLAVDMQRRLNTYNAIVVGPVATVEAALVLILDGEIDAAVLDIRLEGETSFAIADELFRRSIPLVFATSEDPEDVPERYRPFIMPKSATLRSIGHQLFDA